MLSKSNNINNGNNNFITSSSPFTPPSSSPTIAFLVDKLPLKLQEPTTPPQTPPQYRRVVSEASQPRKIPRLNSKRRTFSDTNFINGTPYEHFWDIVGRDNYTTSLNNSQVLCNTISPPVDEDLFSLAFSKKFSSLTWRPKKSFPKIIPTMAPKANNVEPISLVTTTIKPRRSSLESPTIEKVPELLKSKEKMPPVQLVGRKPDTDPVLDINVAEQLRQQLPRRLRLEPSWTLLYSIDQNGTSMTTMYNNVKDKGPLVLALKDENDQVFGAFINESLKPWSSYYGTGECFLWKCIYNDAEESTPPTVEFYLWTGRNEFLIFSEHDYVAIGGGDGRTGLWIDSNLERGQSFSCDTFDNQPLSMFPDFDCLGLEIWGFKN
ncbi:2931_t:CDS:2 [Ambispora leptoticha]|uniref:Oxidation resistance protein 1 n=1 Tax=Ambispora leptoticha TaxID=144679 RepID=A0A9N9A727_9GLOM|nr:2931_t:CDS:2 [Ambispora leptoticha]